MRSLDVHLHDPISDGVDGKQHPNDQSNHHGAWWLGTSCLVIMDVPNHTTFPPGSTRWPPSTQVAGLLQESDPWNSRKNSSTSQGLPATVPAGATELLGLVTVGFIQGFLRLQVVVGTLVNTCRQFVGFTVETTGLIVVNPSAS